MSPGQRRGTLRIYLGAAPGVGTTYAMLDEGRRRAGRGTPVVVAAAGTHGRPATAALLEGLDVVPPDDGAVDVAGVLARRPRVALVDDLARAEPETSPRRQRWQDVEELLDAGVDVVATLDVTELDSLQDVVERITGRRPAHTVPDGWVRSTAQVELVDMTPEALRRRLAHGNVYPAEEIDAALADFFRPERLAALRELALLWVADRVEDQLRGDPSGRAGAGWETRERVVVAVTGAPGSDAVVRRAARLAGRVGGHLLGVRVVGPRDVAAAAPTDLEHHRRLLDELGGTYREVVGDDVAETLVSVARAERATQLVVGASRRSRWQELTGGSVLHHLLRHARDLDVHVIAADGAATTRPAGRRAAPALSGRRRTWAWVGLIAGLPLLVAALLPLRDDVGVTAVLLAALSLVVAVSAAGGLLPGLVAAVAAALATNWWFVPPYGTLDPGDPEDAVGLLVFLLVAATVSTLVGRVARRSAEAARARSDADTLTRAATTLATEEEPVGPLLQQARAALGLDALAVLRATSGGWELVAAAGTPAPLTPTDGDRHPLDDDGAVVLVTVGPQLDAAGTELLEALARTVAVGVEAASLQRDVAAADAVARADAVRRGILQAVSHDLRTPLAGIKASVTSLLSPDVRFGPEDTSAFLATIDHEVDRLDRVVGNLLDMSRLQAGELSVHLRPTALEEVVAAAMDGLDPGRELCVELDVDDSLPLVEVDPALLERAVANVTANALAAQPAGVAVRIDASSVGDRVHLRVVDRGPGIAPEERDRVFAPFQRLGDRSTQAGVGLGLAIAQGFTRAVGGDLDLDDTPGGGLTVTFRLPAVPAGPDGPDSPATMTTAPSTTAPSTPDATTPG